MCWCAGEELSQLLPESVFIYLYFEGSFAEHRILA